MAAVVGSLVLNSFSDLYYVQFRPDLRAYQKSHGEGDHNEMQSESASKAASPNAKAFRSMFASSSIKHTSFSPEVFASFLSRAIYFWVWRYEAFAFLKDYLYTYLLIILVSYQ